MTAERIADYHEKLLVLRLVQVADAFREDAPGLSAQTGFSEAWSAVESWPAGALQDAVRQPLLDRWVSTAERLVAAGVHRRYPGSHPSRHLRNFSLLALSWASKAPDGAAGRVQLLGRRSVPLLFGRALLCTATPTVASTLAWQVRGSMLIIAEPGVGAVADIDLAEPSRSTVTPPSWSLVVPPSAHGILVDLHTPEYVGEHPVDRAGPDLAGAVLRALDTMVDQDRAVVAMYGRCVTVRSRPGPWTAGLIALLGGTKPDLPTRLLRGAHRDRLMRWLALNVPSLSSAAPASPLSDLREALADQGANRILEAADVTAAPRDVLSDLVPGGVPLARGTPGDDGRLVADPFGPVRGSVLELADLPSSGDRPAARLTLTKTRRGTYGDLDWSAVNEMSRLAPDQLRTLRRSPVLDATRAEAADFCAALVAYLVGDWDSCVGALERCLAHDGDVEEYWLLVGFARRHAGKRDEFERIVLSGDRRLGGPTVR